MGYALQVDLHHWAVLMLKPVPWGLIHFQSCLVPHQWDPCFSSSFLSLLLSKGTLIPHWATIEPSSFSMCCLAAQLGLSAHSHTPKTNVHRVSEPRARSGVLTSRPQWKSTELIGGDTPSGWLHKGHNSSHSLRPTQTGKCELASHCPFIIYFSLFLHRFIPIHFVCLIKGL